MVIVAPPRLDPQASGLNNIIADIEKDYYGKHPSEGLLFSFFVSPFCVSSPPISSLALSRSLQYSCLIFMFLSFR